MLSVPVRRGLGLVTVAVVVVGAGFCVLAADDPKQLAYGRHLSAECTSCHRIDGTDNGIPSIIGWERQEFMATLQFYRDGRRRNPAMQSVAQSLDDDQVQALASYFAALSKPQRKR